MAQKNALRLSFERAPNTVVIDRDEISATAQQATALTYANRGSEAVELWRAVIRKLKSDDPRLAIAYLDLGYSLMQADRFEEAEPELRRAVKLLEARHLKRNNPERRFLGRAYNQLGSTLYQLLQIDKSFKAHTRALSIYRGLNDAFPLRYSDAVAQSLNGIAACQGMMGHPDETVRLINEALDILGTVPQSERGPNFTLTTASMLLNRGLAAARAQGPSAGIASFEAAIAQFDSLDEPERSSQASERASASYYLSTLLLHGSRFQEALKCATALDAWLLETNHQHVEADLFRAQVLAVGALAAVGLGDNALAAAWYARLNAELDARRPDGLLYDQVEARLGLARAYIHAGERVEARTALEQALRLAARQLRAGQPIRAEVMAYLVSGYAETSLTLRLKPDQEAYADVLEALVRDPEGQHEVAGLTAALQSAEILAGLVGSLVRFDDPLEPINDWESN